MSKRTSNSAGGFLTMTSKGAVRRIRTPHATDVLLGRGGGINSHSGNKVFREWVRVRKEEYNLAPNKAEKTRVATEVMNQVRNQTPPGRFLQRDTNGGPSGWWIEVDEQRALAKTSQALREGAPQIRAAHQTEARVKVPVVRKRKASATTSTTTSISNTPQPQRQSSPVQQHTPTPIVVPNMPTVNSWPQTVPQATSAQSSTGNETPPETRTALKELGRNMKEARTIADSSTSTPTTTTAAPMPVITRPLMSNREFQQKYTPSSPLSNKRQRVEAVAVPFVDMYADTPPLAPLTPTKMDMPTLSLNPPPKDSSNLKRTHSLALSDFSGALDMDDDFVNPFTDENERFLETSPLPTSNINNDENVNSIPSLPGRPLRNVSSDEGREDYRSMADLYDFPTTQPSSHNLGDFNEEVKTVFDAVQTEEDAKYHDYAMPTLLIPWRGGILKRRYSSNRLARE